MKEIDVSKNLSVRFDEDGTFIVGAKGEVYIDDETDRGMIMLKAEDLTGLISALKTLQDSPPGMHIL